MPDRLPIDVVLPDPDPGDPWPRHLCSPSVDWPAPLAAVLRPDTYHPCGCRSGGCPGHVESAPGPGATGDAPPRSTGIWLLLAVALSWLFFWLSFRVLASPSP